MRKISAIDRCALRVGLLITSMLGALLPSVASAYEVTYLGTYFIPSGINDEGWVTGTVSGQATLFAGRLRTIKTGSSSARAVNNSGDIVGSFSLPDPVTGVTTTHAFRHRDTVNGPTVDDLGSAANSVIANSNYSEAYSINTRGQVVGFARVQVASAPVKFEDHAFLYNDRMIDLALFVGKDNYAYDINDGGDIVGEYKTSDRISHAFLRTNDGLMNQVLPVIGTSSVARAVNNLGHVVGNYTKDGITHAFLFAGGSLKDLGALPGDTASYALDINDHDQIVGYSVSASGVQRAFLYDGAMTDLSTTVETGSTITLWAATAINNKGEIVGHCANVYSYRLSPTPRVELLEHPKLPWNHTPVSGDYFGSILALHGDTLVVGAPGESGGKGALYVYRFENGWIEKQHLTAPNEMTNDRFGGALAFDGTTLVVGAPGRNSAPSAASPVNSGTVLLYSLQNQQWTFTQEFGANDAANGDGFGNSVALFEQTLLVGTAKNAAYIFAANNGQWAQLPRLTSASSGVSLNALAARSNTLVLGSRRSCYYCVTLFDIYERNGAAWELKQSIGLYVDYFGPVNAVALTDARIALGHYYGTSVEIYERSGVDPAAPWVRTDSIKRIFSSVANTYYPQGFGSALAGSGDQLVVGAPFSYINNVNDTTGTAYLYERVGPYWVDRKKITPRESQSGNYFGSAIAISGNTVAVGTNFPTGSAHVFSLCVSACTDIFSADVAVNVTATADTVPVLGNVTLHVTVTNNDTANTANGVMLEFSALNASHVSAPTDCVNLVGKTVCRVGNLGPGVSKTFDITLTASGTTRDMVTDVLVKTSGPDAKPANNAQMITTLVTPTGKPALTITGLTHMSADKTTLVLADDDTASVSFELRSVFLSLNGNKVAVELDAVRISDKNSSVPVDVGPFSAGAHTVTVQVHDAQGTILASASINFTVRLLVPGLILKRPQNNEPIECGLNESVLMDYLTPNWPIAPNGKSIVVIRDQVTSQHYTALEPMDLCRLPDGEHVLELRLVNAAGVVKQSVTAAFTVRRVLPNVELTLPKEGGRYLRGFDMLFEFVHTTPATRAQLILNDGPSQTVNVNSRSLAIAAEQLLPEKNHIVLQLFDGDTPLPSVERVFYVQDATSDASALAASAKSGGGAVDVLLLVWMVVVLSFRLRLGRWRFEKNADGEERSMRLKNRVCGVIALSLLSSAAAQAGEYQITDLGTFDPQSINDKGWVAGTANGQATLFAGRLRTVQTGISVARAVNDAGQVAGTYPFPYTDSGNNPATATHAFRYIDTAKGPNNKDLGYLPKDGYVSNKSEAFGINNSGYVVGYTEIQKSAMPLVYQERAFVFVDAMRDLGIFDTVNGVIVGGVSARAYGINNRGTLGDIVGAYKKSDNNEYAFLIAGNMSSTLPKLNGARSVARAVNNNGLVVGYFYPTATGEKHAFLYDPGNPANPDDDVLTDLGMLTSDTISDAYSINDQGQIVGYSAVKNSNGVEIKRAFLYRNGVMQDLSSLLTTTTGWRLHTAVAINNAGEIAGMGDYRDTSSYLATRAYRLSPLQPVSLAAFPALKPDKGFPGANDNFGNTVAISGDTMVVGAPGENSYQGAAYVYRFVNGAWLWKQRLAAPTAVSGDRFGLSVAIDGGALVIGAPYRASCIGAAFVFERTGDQWDFVQEVSPKAAPTSACFGWSVAINGQILVAGNGSVIQGATIFRRISGRWVEQQPLPVPDYVTLFGHTVAISDGVVGVTARATSGTTDVYIFQQGATQWILMQRIPIGFDIYYSLYPYSYSYDASRLFQIDHNRLVIGVPSQSRVYVYEHAPLDASAPWVLTDQVTPVTDKTLASSVGYASFGASVAMDGDLLLVGAPWGGLYTDGSSTYSGAGVVYVYEHVGQYWISRKRFTASTDTGADAQAGKYFGHALALTGTLPGSSVVVGSNFASGAAYAYSLCSGDCAKRSSADLSIEFFALEPSSVPVFGVARYQIKITNHDSSNTANKAQVTLAIPPSATFDSASPQCSKSFDNVVCGLGDVAAGASVVVDVNLGVPLQIGTMSVTARVGAVGPDPDLSNNSATIITEVTSAVAPQVRITEPTAGLVLRFEGDDLQLKFSVDNVLFSPGGNVVEVVWENTKIQVYSAIGSVSLGKVNGGVHAVKVMVLDNNRKVLAQADVTFVVKVVTPTVVIDYPKPNVPVLCDGTPVSPRFTVQTMPAGTVLELIVDEKPRMSAAAVGQLTLNLCDFSQDQDHILTLRMMGTTYSANVVFRTAEAHPGFELTVPIDNHWYSRSTFEMIYKTLHYKPNTRVELRINGNAPIALNPQDDTFIPPSEQLVVGANTLSVTLYDGDTASPPIVRTFNVQDAVAEAPAKSGGGGGALDLLALGIGIALLRRRGTYRRQRLVHATAASRFPRVSLASRPAAYKSRCADRLPGRSPAHDRPRRSERPRHRCRCQKCAGRLVPICAVWTMKVE